jgi:hypothetical protein
MLVNFMTIGNILRTFGIFCGHTVYFLLIWYIFSRFGMLCQEKCSIPNHEHFDAKCLVEAVACVVLLLQPFQTKLFDQAVVPHNDACSTRETLEPILRSGVVKIYSATYSMARL